MPKLNEFEQALLRDPDVKFGFDNYEVLQQLGALVREMRIDSGLSQSALQEASGVGQAEISRLESGSMERGPSLLTLIRLAHAAGKRLVIGIEDKEGENKASTRVLTIEAKVVMESRM
jgi:transcriptional regulator with XRE-family HTH domain